MFNNGNYRLGDICELKTGRHYPKTNDLTFWNGPHPWLTISDIKPEIYETERTLSQKGLETVRNYSKFLFKKDSFVMACDGATIGKIGWLMKDFYSSTHLINFETKNVITNKYLYYLMLNKKNKLKKLSTGTAIEGLSVSALNGLSVYIPTLDKQKRIIDIIEQKKEFFLKYFKCIRIDNFQNTKNDTQKLIDIIEPFENNIFNLELIFKFLDKFMTCVMNWLLKNQKNVLLIKMRNVCKIQKPSSHPKASDPTLWNGPYPWLMISDIKPEITFTKSSLSEKGLKKIRNPSRSLFKKDTFVVGSVGASIGKIGWLMKDFYCTTAVINFSADDLVTTKLLYYFMMTKKEYLKKIANGSARKNLYVKQIEEIKINLPNLEEQKNIVWILDQITQLKMKIKNLIKAQNNLKMKIINYLTHFKQEK